MLGKLDKFIEKASSIFLVVCLLSIVLLSLFEILFRQFEITYLWIGVFTRHLVFLCSFLGAVIATGSDKHIKIDIFSKVIDPNKKIFIVITSLVLLATTLICVWLSLASIDFLKMEMEYGKEVFWGLHSSVLTAIIPFGFSLISYRFFYSFIKEAKKLL